MVRSQGRSGSPWPARQASGFCGGSSTASNLADGLFQVALPLLAVELTRSPSLVAAVTFSLTLPWLLFALPVGALVDRQDCRRVMVAANLLRAAVLGVLTSAVLLGAVSLPVVFLAALLMGSLRSSPTLRRRPSCRPSCPTTGWKAPMPGSWAPRRSPTGHGPTTGWCADRLATPWPWASAAPSTPSRRPAWRCSAGRSGQPSRGSGGYGQRSPKASGSWSATGCFAPWRSWSLS